MGNQEQRQTQTKKTQKKLSEMGMRVNPRGLTSQRLKGYSVVKDYMLLIF